MSLAEDLNASQHRLDAIERQYRRQRGWLAIVVLVGVIVNAWFYSMVAGLEMGGPTLMRFSDAYTTGATQLCPGEALFYTLTLEVDKPGIFAIDISVWSVDPPSVALWSETRRVVFSEATTYTLPRVWTVPALHPDPTTGELVPWLPGKYERRHAISTISRSTEPSIIEIPFQIREDCE